MSQPKAMSEVNIRAIYDSFEKKDMPYAEFRRELIDIQNPNKMVKDLKGIQLRKAREQMNRMKIDKRLNQSQ